MPLLWLQQLILGLKALFYYATTMLPVAVAVAVANGPSAVGKTRSILPGLCQPLSGQSRLRLLRNYVTLPDFAVRQELLCHSTFVVFKESCNAKTKNYGKRNRNMQLQ